MSLNLGPRAEAALASLRGNESWKVLCEELAAKVSEHAHRALDAAPDVVPAAAAYARGLRDLWVAFEAATVGERQNKIEKPRVTRSTTTTG